MDHGTHAQMLRFDTPEAYQEQCLEWRRRGLSHVLVPTMGALHEGHVLLINTAREIAERVSVSIFLNPTQFGPDEDFEAYPRPLEADLEICRDLKVDVVFAPDAALVYPDGFRTTVRVSGFGEGLCGRYRPGHFNGVTTIVSKLFNLALPTDAVFGWKDAQQLIVLKRLVKDMNMSIVMHGVETVREPDGLACSTRNVYLDPDGRVVAGLVYEGLSAARIAFAGGENRTAELESIIRVGLEKSSLINIQYIESCSMSTLERIRTVEPGNTLIATAVMIGEVRLIDNIRL